MLHHAFPAQKPYRHLEIKEKRRDLKIIYILAIKGRTATIMQRYFSNLNHNNKFNFRQKLSDAYGQRQNVFSRNSVGWFILTWYFTLYHDVFEFRQMNNQPVNTRSGSEEKVLYSGRARMPGQRTCAVTCVWSECLAF